jgi:hypothetical protein
MNNKYLRTNDGPANIEWTDDGKGIIDSDAIKAFSWGWCHSFAYAMHDVTGWPIIGLGGEVNSPGHFVVYDPEIDDFVDIQGRGALDRYEHLAYNMRVWDSQELPEFYRPIDKKLAEPFVRSVLEKLHKTSVPNRTLFNAYRVPGLVESMS